MALASRAPWLLRGTASTAEPYASRGGSPIPSIQRGKGGEHSPQRVPLPPVGSIAPGGFYCPQWVPLSPAASIAPSGDPLSSAGSIAPCGDPLPPAGSIVLSGFHSPRRVP